MTAGFSVGPSLSPSAWEEIRLRAIFEHCKWDPHSEDHSVLADYPFLLQRSTVVELQTLSEALSREAFAAEAELLQNPNLWPTLGISAAIRAAMLKSGTQPQSRTVRAMRFDFHWTDDGWRISELNADVPGGYVESGGWNALFAEQLDDVMLPPNPGLILAKSIRNKVETGALVGLIHSTNYSEDRQVVMSVANELRNEGMRPILAGPTNVEFRHGAPLLKTRDSRIEAAAIVRIFPAEWLPQVRSSSDWTQWFAPSCAVHCNPCHALLLQSKRFPLVWPELDSPLPTWKRLLPVTRQVNDVDLDREDWVLKPAFGRVGEDIAIKHVASETDFQKIAKAARRNPAQWVAQRKFVTQPLQAQGRTVYPCIGVFTVDGKFAGLYGRAGATPLVDQDAQDVAVVVSGK